MSISNAKVLALRRSESIRGMPLSMEQKRKLVRKANPYHDDAGQFTSKDKAVERNLGLSGVFKDGSLRSIIDHMQQKHGLVVLAKGREFHPDDYELETLSRTTTAPGRIVSMEGKSSSALGFRRTLQIIDEQMDAMPENIKNAVKVLQPKILGVLVSNVNGRSWINRNAMTFDYLQVANAEQQAGDLDRISKALKYPGYKQFSMSQEAYRGYDGTNARRVVEERMKMTFVHELGHLLTSPQIVQAAQDRLPLMAMNEGKGKKEWIESTLHRYATSNVHEFLAESFTMYNNPAMKTRVSLMPDSWKELMDAMVATKLMWPKDKINFKAKYLDTGIEPDWSVMPEVGSEAWYAPPEDEDWWVDVLKVMKENPYHDVAGQFTTKDKDAGTGLKRLGSSWVHEDGKEMTADERARIDALKIPPGWSNVRLNPNKTAALQAFGTDSKGRIQSKYSAKHSAHADAEKFARVKDFTIALPEIRKGITAGMNAPPGKLRDTAAVLHLIDKTAFRIGSTDETGGAVKAYGASTLLGRHVSIDGDSIEFNFTGKKGVPVHKTIVDAKMAKFIRDKKVGEEDRIFNTDDDATRAFLKGNGGAGFKVKDFRTYHGTALALSEIKKRPIPKDAKEYQKMRMEVAKRVAEHLGNTPTVALAAYIAPTVFKSWGPR